MQPVSVTLTREQVRRVDRIAIEELGIPGVVLMENAGRGAADIIRAMLEQHGGRRAVIFCGRGNNGGDGFVVARHLLNAGCDAAIHATSAEVDLRGDALVNFRILRNMGVTVDLIEGTEAADRAAAALSPADLVVDALLGTGFQGGVRPPLADLIEAINAAPKSAVVAIDIPSGLDCDTGRPGHVAIRADATVTFVAAKVGFAEPGAAEWTGTVSVVDIGAPPSLIQRV